MRNEGPLFSETPISLSFHEPRNLTAIILCRAITRRPKPKTRDGSSFPGIRTLGCHSANNSKRRPLSPRIRDRILVVE